MRRLQVPIRILSVFNPENENQHDVIMDGVKGAKISVPNAVRALFPS